MTERKKHLPRHMRNRSQKTHESKPLVPESPKTPTPSSLVRARGSERLRNIVATLTLAAADLSSRSGVNEFLQSYGHDFLAASAWFAVTRGMTNFRETNNPISRFTRSSANIALPVVISYATEFMQLYMSGRPHTEYTGTYDPMDLVAYTAGVGLAFGVKRWIEQPVREARKAGN